MCTIYVYVHHPIKFDLWQCLISCCAINVLKCKLFCEVGAKFCGAHELLVTVSDM